MLIVYGYIEVEHLVEHLETSLVNNGCLPQVAWVRVDTQTILTIHNNVITRNPRISLSRPGENKWYLHLNSVQESDRGWYMCQINTDPMVHRSHIMANELLIHYEQMFTGAAMCKWLCLRQSLRPARAMTWWSGERVTALSSYHDPDVLCQGGG